MTTENKKTAVWWVRRDLRLSDNQALTAALDTAEQVIPLFILDPFFDRSEYVGRKRRAFLWAGLRQLNADLRRRGSRLLVRRGEPEAVLGQLLSQTGADAIFAQADYSNYARRRDEAVAASLPLHLTDGLVVHHPEMVLKDDGDPYLVFTPFKKNAWLERPLPTRDDLLSAPDHIPMPADLNGDPIPELPQLPPAVPFTSGEAEARRRLESFVADGIFAYADRRSQLDEAGTSGLSPYLRFGMVSARQAVMAALEAKETAPDKNGRRGADTWLSELIWREFYVSILYHFPHVLWRSFRPKYDNIRWRNDEAEFAAWKAGQTGYPLVDAAMRQLKTQGWMHNRARMVVASFLVKDLLIDWRWGERWFMQQLVDGDPAANNGGWQWTAGTGADAAPYFRIFNPVSQSKKHDPDGRFIRRWLPELADVPDKYIHIPWQLPPDDQQVANCRLDVDYPTPIVDHKTARERTLTAYKSAR